MKCSLLDKFNGKDQGYNKDTCRALLGEKFGGGAGEHTDCN